MHISFVIPAYNEENYIGGCLDAILNATRAANDSNDYYEIIIVDNNRMYSIVLFIILDGNATGVNV